MVKQLYHDTHMHISYHVTIQDVVSQYNNMYMHHVLQTLQTTEHDVMHFHHEYLATVCTIYVYT